MEFRHLASFIAIAEELHFGKAAARLHLTQPSLSAQLQKLEKSLGVQLVVRNSHEVRLTSAGEDFEAHARLIMRQMEQAASSAQSTAAGLCGSLNVGYNMPAGRYILPYAMARMSREHPDISISLWEKRTGPQLAGLVDRSLDLALAYGRPHGAHFRHRRLLANIPIVAIVGRSHRWAGRKVVRFSDLAGEQCLMFGRDQTPAMYDAIFNAAADCGIEVSVAQSADDPGATAHMVTAKPLVGFASLPRAVAVGLGVTGPDPVAVKLVDPVPVLDLYAVWRAEETNAAVAHFLDCIEVNGPDEHRMVG
ncbi:LysR family transcriptional regulator [Gordonia polyisoprenivorans]|uniref:LysR family transcriptional regulator n=1 Tax=Gordonia polyisoprenivorans TaxID=84595 RepID=UPI000B99EA01|nr:LysR family transcriptional regulator [Gordonia polyisoprenivorans]OZC31803.1 LysR family transcriptional regulator [Gordonia polyisoprenivorans]